MFFTFSKLPDNCTNSNSRSCRADYKVGIQNLRSRSPHKNKTSVNFRCQAYILHIIVRFPSFLIYKTTFFVTQFLIIKNNNDL